MGGARWQEPGEENQLKSIMLENDMTNILYVKKSRQVVVALEADAGGSL